MAFFLYKSRARQGILSSILIPGLGFNALKIGELCAKKEKYEEDFVCSWACSLPCHVLADTTMLHTEGGTANSFAKNSMLISVRWYPDKLQI